MMKTKIACVSCGEFFEPEPKEIRAFIEKRADRRYLRRIPFTQEMRAQFKDREAYVEFLLLAYCPYCREVKFGSVGTQQLPKGELSEVKYLRNFEDEARSQGGHDIREDQDVYPVLAENED